MKLYIQSATSANDITSSIRANAESILRNLELLEKAAEVLMTTMQAFSKR